MPRTTTLRAGASRPQPIHTLVLATLLAALLAACNAAPGGSPSPTTGPTGSPNPSGSPSGSPTPTGTPTPTSTPSPTPSPTFGESEIEHPTGATDIVLRWEMGGGFVPMEVNMTHIPHFTLYGDGTVVFRSNEPWSFGNPPSPMLTGRMSEEALQALLLYAVDTGKLATARETYENMTCADCSTTTFVLNAGGVEKVVSVYALSDTPEPGPDRADLAGFAQLQNLLMNFEDEANSGTVDELTEYDAATYRVIMLDAMGGQPSAEPIDWPWGDITLDDFPAGGDEPGRILHMDRDQVAQLTDVPNSGAGPVWVVAPDDTVVQFLVRPLLPDEVEATGL